ncbi:hypothetical protein PG112206_1485 [Bifidobacterium pseudolongum subsp. globosum]|nr:hypothetical protein PG112206_1485 [Bifidobacterium pseudolongum subsp. globosum]
MMHFNEPHFPAWVWIILIIAVAISVIWMACEIWKAGHRSVLLGRARAHASKGIRISDEDAKQIHLHKRLWATRIHVPREWLTDAEASAFAGDIARIWGYDVLMVKPSRCWKSCWMQAVWTICLGKAER